MRRLMVLVAVVLVLVVVLVASAAPALARRSNMGTEGTPLPALVCDTPASISPIIGWRNGQCWVFHPVAP